MNGGGRRPGRPIRWLISLAARCTPPALSVRLEEEWLAHVHSCPSRWSQFRLALGFVWASAVIARTHADAGARMGPDARPASMGGGSVTFSEPNLRYLSLRPGTLFLILELQAALLCGLILPL